LHGVEDMQAFICEQLNCICYLVEAVETDAEPVVGVVVVVVYSDTGRSHNAQKNDYAY